MIIVFFFFFKRRFKYGYNCTVTRYARLPVATGRITRLPPLGPYGFTIRDFENVHSPVADCRNNRFSHDHTHGSRIRISNIIRNMFSGNIFDEKSPRAHHFSICSLFPRRRATLKKLTYSYSQSIPYEYKTKKTLTQPGFFYTFEKNIRTLKVFYYIFLPPSPPTTTTTTIERQV